MSDKQWYIDSMTIRGIERDIWERGSINQKFGAETKVGVVVFNREFEARGEDCYNAVSSCALAVFKFLKENQT